MKPYHKTFKELLQSDYEDEGFRALKEAVLERIDIYDDVRESQELRDLEQECNGLQKEVYYLENRIQELEEVQGRLDIDNEEHF